MASSLSYEFHCPQFRDFSEVDSSSNNESELGGFSPDAGNAALVSNIQAKFFLKNKAHPFIKRTIPARQTAVDHSSNTTDSEKWCISKVELSKRLSKSDGSVNLCSRNLKPSTYDSIGFSSQQNWSLSESDLRPKTQKFPTTPMCLKRTLCRAKIKKLKTSEELELEKIAELQKQMHEHLRANEIAMRRLKIKMKPYTVQREWTKTDLRSRDNFQVNVPKDHKVLGKLNGFRQNTSPSGTQERIDIKGIVTTKTERAKKVMSSLSQLQRNTSRLLSENNQDPKSEADWLIKNKQPRPYVAHSGLAYLAGNQKIATFKPFNFNKKAKDTGLDSSCRAEKEISIKDQIKMQIPRTCHKFAGKENNASQSSFSDAKNAKDPKRRTLFHISKGKKI